MVLRAGPSGPLAGQIVPFEYDWGTIPPGPASFVTIDLSALVPAGAAYSVTTLGPFPVSSFGLAIPGNDNGVRAALLQAQNFSGSPLLVGRMRYLITYWLEQVMQ